MAESGRRAVVRNAPSSAPARSTRVSGAPSEAADAPRITLQPATGRRIVSPTAQAVAAEVAAIPRGAVLALDALGARLAARYGADECSAAALHRCLVFLAGVVAGDLRHGRTGRWPIWRVTNENGQLPGNWPLDARWRAAVLREEGRVIRFARARWATEPSAAQSK